MSVKQLKKSLKEYSQENSEFSKFLQEDNSDQDDDLNIDINLDDDYDDYKGDNAVDDIDYDNVNEDDIDDENNDGESETDNQKELMVASDDEYSDFPDTDSNSEPDTQSLNKPVVNKILNIKTINKWRNKLQTNNIEALKFLIMGFKAAVNFSHDHKDEDAQFVVMGGTVYNSIIGACLVDLLPALSVILNDSFKNQPYESKDKDSNLLNNFDLKYNAQKHCIKYIQNKNWKVVKISVKSYILDLLRLLNIIGKDDVLMDLMKHLYDMCIYICAFPKFHKPTTKKCIEFWSTSKEEAIRIISLRCILALMPYLSHKLAEYTLSKMYISFAQNSKFTSANTLSEISYMRRSLIELFSIKPNIAYTSAFLNIRQMARLIHNALKLQKKEVKQSICNWQFIHPLCMYCSMIGRLHGDEYVRSLIHPIIEIMLGTMRLNESGSYFPMRIILVRNLIQLSQSCKIYIPLSPYILEILDYSALLKNPKQSSIKNLNMDCILRASKSELKEKAFCDGLVESVFELSLMYLSNQSNSIAFPELSLPFLIQLRKFLKHCKVAPYTRKMKLLLTKIEENIQFVQRIRKKSPINLANVKSLESIEFKIQEANPPLTKFYDNWIKVSIKNKEIIANPKQKDMDDLPKIIRRPKATEEDRKEFKGLFMQESDEDNSDDEERFAMKDEKDKYLKKGSNISDNSKKRKQIQSTNISKNNKLTKRKKTSLNNDCHEKNDEGTIFNHIEISNGDDLPDKVEDFDLTDI